MESRSGKIRVGLIGAGFWATQGHLPVLNLLPDYEVTALYTRRPDVANHLAAQFEIAHVFDSMTALTEDSDVDLVAVLTRAPQHEEGVRAAIAAGKDVYCEWPLTTTSETSGALLDLAGAAGVRHVVGLQRRLAPVFVYLRQLLADGYIGRLRSVRLYVSVSGFRPRRPQSLKWMVPPENFSNVISIFAGHFLDALFTAAGWPVSVSSVMVNQFNEIEIIETKEVLSTSNPDQLVLAGEMKNGAVLSAHIEGAKRNGSGVQLDLTGDDGDLRITNTSAFGDVHDNYRIEGAKSNSKGFSPLPIPNEYQVLSDSGLPWSALELANLYAAYARDVFSKTYAAPTFEDGLRMHRFLDQVSLASRTGQRVMIDDDV